MKPLAIVLALSGLAWSPSLDALQCVAPVAPRLLQPGDEAPDFEMRGTDGRTHRLSDYRGKQAVVLAWFSKAFSTG